PHGALISPRVVAAGLFPRFGRHAHEVLRPRLPPHEPRFASVGPLPRRRLAVVGHDLGVRLGGDADEVARSCAPPDIRVATGMQWIGGPSARRLTPPFRVAVVGVRLVARGGGNANDVARKGFPPYEPRAACRGPVRAGALLAIAGHAVVFLGPVSDGRRHADKIPRKGLAPN